MNPLLAGFDWGRAMLVLALVCALGLGYASWASHERDIGEVRATATYEKALKQQKDEAKVKLDAETAKVQALETQLLAAVAAQEDKDETNQNTVAGLERRLAVAVAARGGRLRDPNAAGCGGGGGGAQGADPAGAGDRAGDAAEAGGLLSAQLTGLLQRLLREADDINDAYSSCRGQLDTVTRLINEQAPTN